MKNIIGLILLVVTFVFSQNTHSNSSKLSVKFTSGINHYPLKEWKDFFDGFENYEQDAINIFGSVCFYYQVDEQNFFYFETEYLKTKAYDKDNLYSSLTWNFEGIPLTIGYENKMNAIKEKIKPFISVGISYFFSKLTYELKYNPEILPFNVNSEGERKGKGYGYYGEFGIIYMINNSLFTTLSYRARYADGMYFTDNKKDVPVEFTSHGLNIGIGYNFD